MMNQTTHDTVLSPAEEKRELLAHLLRERASAGTEAVFPLSYGQEALWLLHRLDPADPAYNEAWPRALVPYAAVHGVAFGGGFQIALGPDIRYATADARFSVMEIKWGLVPDLAGTQLMRHLAREDVVRELTYTGRIFNGTEAQQMGFVTRVVDDPRAAAFETAREIAAKSGTVAGRMRATIARCAPP